MIDSGLEYRVGYQRNREYRSEGERRIARFLQDNHIRYQYEPAVLVNAPEGKPRIWYPDFHLPEFSAYIEYFGLAGRRSYDAGVKRKLKTYESMGYQVIPIFPWTFAEDWKGYTMSELKRVARGRYENLMSKPYWSSARKQTYGSSTARARYGSRRGGYR